MDEQFLEQYKKVYLQVQQSDDALRKSWDDLSLRLPKQDLPAQNLIFRYRFLFAGMIFLMLAGTVGIAQASRSGELLYPVKILTNNVAAKIFGKPEITSRRQEKTITVEPSKTPTPTEKELNEKQNDLKQEEKEIKGKNEIRKNENKEVTPAQETQVKGVNTQIAIPVISRGNEVSEINKQKNEERRESNGNKSEESNNGNINKEKNKNENRGNSN